MTTFIATIAIAIAPAVDAIGTLVHKAPNRRHHRRHHRRRHRDPLRFQVALASFYSYPPGASTACGYATPNGVANRSLPCGTRVRFCAARCATGTVDDRGPFIYDRLWDLSVPLAQAIGFDFQAGVAPVRWALQ